MRKVSVKRHIAKSISWRALATIDTIIISWILTDDPISGIQIGVFEIISKTIFYILHERLWLHIPINQSRKRHLLKTFSWRIIGTIDTVFLGWLVTGSIFVGMKIGGFEVITKLFLYYFHERLWYKLRYGILNT